MTARILVVDDIAANRKVLEAKLAAEYYDVSQAASGIEALTAVDLNPPDLILLDVMMPDISGYEVCRQLKADHRYSHIPVVMVTALDSPQDMVQGLESGADDFLTKPLDNLALFARVRSLVRLKRVLDEWRLREGGPLGDAGYEALANESVTDAHVFVMSNSPSVQHTIGEVASALDHRVDYFADGTDPAAALSATEFDLILADVAYPGFDALRLCSMVRSNEDTRHLPFVLIGDRDNSERLYKGLDLGANEYLLRPLNSNEVTARLKTQLRRHRLQQRVQNRHQASLNQAVTDALTGLYNRHYMEAHVRRLFARAVSEGRPLSFIIVDLDRFKAINDTYGHPAGDRVLRHVAERLTGGVRTPDLVVRFGGEEFVVVLPETPAEEAAEVAERLRRTIAATPIPLDDGATELRVTASFGISAVQWDEASADVALQRADEALYRSKNEGRNRVTIAPRGGLSTQGEALAATQSRPAY